MSEQKPPQRTGRMKVQVVLSLAVCLCFASYATAIQSPVQRDVEAEDYVEIADGPINDDIPTTASLSLKPNNTAVLVGDRATLECTSTTGTTSPRWAFTPIGSSVYTIVISGGVVNPEYLGRFDADNVGGGGMNLVIISATIDDAGTYSCMEHTGFSVHSSAKVAVLYEEPNCLLNSTHLFDGEIVMYSCEVRYTSNISPMYITWVDDTNDAVEASGEEFSNGNSFSFIVYTARPDVLPIYRSLVHFSVPGGIPWHGNNNTPSYSHSWTSPDVVVKYALMVPQDTTADVGFPVNMTCRRRSTNIIWTFIPEGDPQSYVIVAGCSVMPESGDMYSVDTDHEACNLIITSTTLGHAGVYTCQNVGTAGDSLPYSATLSVLPLQGVDAKNAGDASEGRKGSKLGLRHLLPVSQYKPSVKDVKAS